MQQWYYLEGREQVGPLPEEEFMVKVQEGTVTDRTLVWHDGMPDWQPYGQTDEASGSVVTGPPGGGSMTCPTCGQPVSSEDIAQIGAVSVCPYCKDQVVQRMREGLAPVGLDVHYAGFWIRFCALFVDGIILRLILMAPTYMLTRSLFYVNPENTEMVGAGAILLPAISMMVALCYYVGFVGKFQATPGKMACGLRIITSDGGRVSYLRALGRYFGTMLSGLILCIGYLLCIGDSEKRCLHDRLCNTRVVWK